jgi:hypothetical protein
MRAVCGGIGGQVHNMLCISWTKRVGYRQGSICISNVLPWQNKCSSFVPLLHLPAACFHCSGCICWFQADAVCHGHFVLETAAILKAICPRCWDGAQ